MSKWEDVDLWFIIFWPNKNINLHGYLWIYKTQTESNSSIDASYQVKKIIILSQLVQTQLLFRDLDSSTITRFIF